MKIFEVVNYLVLRHNYVLLRQFIETVGLFMGTLFNGYFLVAAILQKKTPIF